MIRKFETKAFVTFEILTVTFDQLNTSLLNKSRLWIINCQKNWIAVHIC